MNRRKRKNKCTGEQWPSHWHSRTTIHLGTIDVTALFLELNEIRHIMNGAKRQAHRKEEGCFLSPVGCLCALPTYTMWLIRATIMIIALQIMRRALARQSSHEKPCLGRYLKSSTRYPNP